jgi:hypothetical protein
MSAFLYYSQEKRHEVKESFPDMKNTEVSRMLGEMWRNAPEEERKPHIDREKVEREKYKVEIASWRKEYEAKVESQRRLQPEQPQFLPVSCGGDQSSVRMPPTPLAGMPYDPSVAAAPMPPIPQQPFMGHGGYGYPGFYRKSTKLFQFLPSNMAYPTFLYFSLRSSSTRSSPGQH